MAYPKPDEIAAYIAALYKTEFGGKRLGRFCVGVDLFKRIAGRDRLENSIVHKVGEALRTNHNLILIDLGNFFGVIEESKILAWRSVPQKAVQAILDTTKD